MLKKIEEYFKTIGCSVVEINVMTNNTDAYALYKDRLYQ